MAVAAAVVATLVGIGTGPADAAFRTAAGNPVSTIRASTSFHPYATEVLGDSPYLYWRLDETGGTTVADSGPGGRTGTLLAQTYALAQTGALTSESPNRALGLTIGSVTAAAGAAGPSTFSVEAWIRTTSTTGGRILGFGNAGGSTTSTTVDRQLYLGANGYVYFGVGSAKTTVGSTAAVNNGAWHHVVGTYAAGTNGMKLYVDGTLQGQATASVQGFTGFWRAGAEHLTGWTSNPDDYFEGTLDELAVYSTVLTPTQITSHGANAVN